MQTFTEQAKAHFLQVLESETGLELFCYCQNNIDTSTSRENLCRLLGRADSALAQALAALAEFGFLALGQGGVVSFKAVDQPEVKRLLEEFISTHREEYGATYKKVLTAQIADFLKTKYEDK